MAIRIAAAGKPVAVLDTGWHTWLVSDTARLVPPVDWSSLPWATYGALLLSVVDTTGQPVLGVREAMLCARTAGVPVIIDESVTGFGRLGTLWGQEKVGLVADLTVLGGPCGGGLPLGVVVGLADFFDGPLDVSPQSGHPWPCAAGATTLQNVHPGVLDHVKESAQVLSDSLTQLVDQFPHRLDGHHGDGLLRGVRFTDPKRAEMFPLSARGHGLHLAPAVGNTVVLAPVLIASTYEVTRGVDIMADVLMSWEDG
jgi:4-aminobutyrate aminotransferase-like enzyme